MLERAVFTTAMSSISIAVASETTARATLRVIELFSVREGMWQRLAEQAFAVRTAHRLLGVRLSLVRSPQSAVLRSRLCRSAAIRSGPHRSGGQGAPPPLGSLGSALASSRRRA